MVADKEAFIKTYLSRASAIPEVQMILVKEGISLLTIIDVPGSEHAPETRIFEAEMEALDHGGGAYAEFKIMNVRRLSGPLEDYVSNDWDLLFRRDSADGVPYQAAAIMPQ